MLLTQVAQGRDFGLRVSRFVEFWNDLPRVLVRPVSLGTWTAVGRQAAMVDQP